MLMILASYIFVMLYVAAGADGAKDDDEAIAACASQEASEFYWSDPLVEFTAHISLLQRGALARVVQSRGIGASGVAANASLLPTLEPFVGASFLGASAAQARQTVAGGEMDRTVSPQSKAKANVTFMRRIRDSAPGAPNASWVHWRTTLAALQVASSQSGSLMPFVMVLGFVMLIGLVVVACLVCERYLDPALRSKGSGDADIREPSYPPLSGHPVQPSAETLPSMKKTPWQPGVEKLPLSPNGSQMSPSSPEVSGSAGGKHAAQVSGRGTYSSSSGSLSSHSSEASARLLAQQVPPPICPSLVLPMEAGFAVPVVNLASSPGQFDILGLAGEKLLTGAVRHASDLSGWVLEISIGMGDAMSVASCGPPRDAGPSSDLEICGSGGVPYGKLLKSGPGRYAVQRGATLAMLLESDYELNHFSIKASNGSRLAMVTRCSAGSLFYKFEHYEVWVNPGVDGILVLLCLLSVVLLELR